MLVKWGPDDLVTSWARPSLHIYIIFSSISYEVLYQLVYPSAVLIVIRNLANLEQNSYPACKQHDKLRFSACPTHTTIICICTYISSINDMHLMWRIKYLIWLVLIQVLGTLSVNYIVQRIMILIDIVEMILEDRFAQAECLKFLKQLYSDLTEFYLY